MGLEVDDEKPWHSYLTIDLFARVLYRSIFHPFIAILIPLSICAATSNASNPSVIYTCVWAIVVITYHILSTISHRIAYGKPRSVDLEEEVVVITGGASGLGCLIAEIYGMRGVSVAVLDVKEMDSESEEGRQSVRWYKCDVGDRTQVERAAKEIEKDLGRPTILINCAAASIHGSPILSLPPTTISTTLTTNLLSHYHTLQTFLPGLLDSPTGGTIVTVSSILAHLPPANLSVYAASKAALSALHTSLSAELRGQPQIKTLLVETGQMATALFAGVVETPNTFLAPVLETREVAKEIVQRINAGEGGVVRLPEYARWVSWFGVLPAGVQRVVRLASGIDEAVGRKSTQREFGNGEKGQKGDMVHGDAVVVGVQNVMVKQIS